MVIWDDERHVLWVDLACQHGILAHRQWQAVRAVGVLDIPPRHRCRIAAAAGSVSAPAEPPHPVQGCAPARACRRACGDVPLVELHVSLATPMTAVVPLQPSQAARTAASARTALQAAPVAPNPLTASRAAPRLAPSAAESRSRDKGEAEKAASRIKGQVAMTGKQGKKGDSIRPQTASN